ncbi:MAG: hypothetical protein MMC23_005934 [Stictis urceolatum]|nr:hypothetical protein [Stictis urceolata]
MADVFLFIYQRKWDVSKTTLCHYLDMYSQAEYFELEDLKDLAENAIRQNVRDKTMTADFRESIKRAYNYEVPDAKELQHLLTVPAAQNWQMLKMQRAFMSFVKEDGNLDFNRQLMKMLNLPPLPTKSQDNDVAVLKKNLLQPRKKTGSGPGPGRPRKVTVLRASASGNN